MQNFFGFIDYQKNDFFIDKYDKDNNSTLIYQEHKNHNFFLFYKKNSQTNVIDDKNILLFLNGNISNKSYLLNQLNLSNKSLTTVEILKEAYLQWGMKLLKKIEGSFALIVYDKKNELLTLSKDKIGTVPLNFYNSKELIVFASRVSSFKEAPNFTPTISPEGLALYLQFGYIIQPNSILKDCYKVKSAESNNFNLRRKEHYSSSYWSLESEYQEKKLFPNESEIIKESQQILNTSLEKLQNKNQKTAVSLSGGYDSSTIAALLQKQCAHKIETFTIGFEENSINEAPHAQAIADHLGTQHHEHYFTAKDGLKIIPELCKIYDEPFADHAAAPTLLTTEMIKAEGIENLFVGDGGDEVFATADDVHFFNRIQRVPYGLRNVITSPLKKINMDMFSYLKDTYNLPTKYDKFLQILSAKNIAHMTEARNILFREKELQKLVKQYKKPNLTTFNEINFTGFQEPVDEIIGTYFKTSMIDGELVKSYSASNHNQIYLHTPFLDDKLVAYMAKVPSSVKIKDGIKKFVLKEIAHEHIPKTLLDRPKCGFDIPFSYWMRHELRDLVYAQVNEERLNKDNLFYTSFIINLRDKFYEGNETYKYKLWRIFLFQLWYENFKG